MSAKIIKVAEQQIDVYRKPVTKDFTINDIITHPSLNDDDKELILASYGQLKINQVDKNEIGQKLTQIIRDTIFASGFGSSLSEEEIIILIREVIRDIFMDFKHLTLEEVKIALYKGVRQEYGEYVGISIRNFYYWIRKYVETTKTKLGKKLYLILNKMDKKVTKGQKYAHFLRWRKKVIDEYNDFCKSGSYEIDDLNHLLYDYLYEMGHIKVSIVFKYLIYVEAYINISDRYQVKKAKNKLDRKYIVEFLESMNKRDRNFRKKMNSEMKNVALKRFLTYLKDNKDKLGKYIIKKAMN